MQPVGQRAHEQAHHRIENNKGKTGQKPELGVGEPKIRHDEIGKTGKQLPVNEIHHINDGEQA